MSLFSVCSWWSTQCADVGDQYDVASLLCARFGVEEKEKDYIIVGSQSGQLSIYYPHAAPGAAPNGNAYEPSDLLLETQLNEPILGLYSGKFSGNVRNGNINQLAVLQPNAVAIYNVQATSGLATHGSQLHLQLQVEHKFRRVAFSLCQGHFGQVKGREFFCVVHLDGTLTFYEQDGISYECRFPGHRALPAPVAYCARTDSFFRFSATWHLECFSYQDLSHSLITKSSYQPTWSQCIGEGIIDMRVVQLKEQSSWIVVLGERNFICLDDNGKLNFVLKLDYAPKCFHSFVVGYYWEPGARLITAIVSDSGKLHIYEETNITWAAQYQHLSPVSLLRTNIHNLPGGIVTLSAKGHLQVGYLGTDPFVFQVPPLNIEQLSFTEAQKQLQQLEDEIKEAIDITDMDALNQQAADNVRFSFSIKPEAMYDLDTLLLDVPADVAVKELPSAKGHLRLKTKVELSELQVVFNPPSGVRCSSDTLSFIDIPAGTTKELKMDFYIAELLHMHTTHVDVIASFISTRGIPRILRQTAYLPLSMFYKSCSPQKTAGIKLTYTIVSRQVTPKLATFFKEFIEPENEAQVLGLRLLCPGLDKLPEVITIVAAKNSNRLRIQSDHVEPFAMILERIVDTSLQLNDAGGLLNHNKKKPKKGSLNRYMDVITVTPFIPIQAILHRIDVHNETQKVIRKLTTELESLWQLFKTLQRKLQEQSEAEAKEALVMQIEENYDHLIREGDKLAEIRKDERRQRSDLNCAISLSKWIIHGLNLEERVVNIVQSVLTVPIEDWTELSWEESMAPGIDMLHHFGPLTRSKGTSTYGLLEATSSQDSFDYSRFRRHFVALFERIVRLASMDGPKPPIDDELPEVTGKPPPPVVPVMLTPIDEVGNVEHRLIDATTSEEVQDGIKEEEEEEEEYDEEDLRDVGFRKEYGAIKPKQEQNEHQDEYDNQKPKKRSDWVNEDFELPTTEELFSDLGIWW